mgnify:CR=1 FL=1
MKVLVTGGSGIVGHYVIDELYKLGHEVVNADKFRMTSNLGHSGTTGQLASAETAVNMRENWPKIPTFFEVEISDYGQVISAMDGCDAVISLASRPSAANYVEEDVVKTNTMSMWNVCRAAEQLKVKRVALGSSYNSVGAMGTAARWAPNEVKPPQYFPMDENVYTRSEDPYQSLSGSERRLVKLSHADHLGWLSPVCGSTGCGTMRILNIFRRTRSPIRGLAVRDSGLTSTFVMRHVPVFSRS